MNAVAIGGDSSTVAPPRRLTGTLGALAISGIDQGLLSALNLGIAVAFIKTATKEEYGLYTLVNGLVLLMGGVQAALVISPLVANGARLEEAARRTFIAAVFWLQVAMAGICAVLLVGMILVGNGGSEPVLLALGGGLAVLGTWMREFHRSVAFLEHRAESALKGDVIYLATAAVVLGAIVFSTGSLHAWNVLVAIGAAAFFPGLVGFIRSGRAVLSIVECRCALAILIGQGRWTLPGMAVTWGQNSGYSYIVAWLLGSAAVAELSAARLFVMPLNTLVAAWGKIFVPRAGKRLADGDRAGLLAMCRKSVLGLVGAAIAWLALVGAFFWLGGTRLLPEKYQGLAVPVFVWCLFALVNAARNVASQALLAHAAFRVLFHYGAVAAAASVALVFAIAMLLGEGGAVFGLVGGELLLAGLCWTTLLRHSNGLDALAGEKVAVS